MVSNVVSLVMKPTTNMLDNCHSHLNTHVSCCSCIYPSFIYLTFIHHYFILACIHPFIQTFLVLSIHYLMFKFILLFIASFICLFLSHLVHSLINPSNTSQLSGVSIDLKLKQLFSLHTSQHKKVFHVSSFTFLQKHLTHPHYWLEEIPMVSIMAVFYSAMIIIVNNNNS